MEYQNITLSLPKNVLRRIKHIAVEKQTSVSALLTKALQETVKEQEAYEKARQHHLAVLNGHLDLGTNGHLAWRRVDLHER